MTSPDVDPEENMRRMKAGELYYAFTPELKAERRRCKMAQALYNEQADNITRRQQVELYQDLVSDEMEMPKKHITRSEEDDDELLQDFPTLIPPVMMSYGFHVKLGNNVFVGPNSTWVDTCQISIGARTLIGPNCSFLSATRPLDPTVRNGTRGPEAGKPIVIGEDCWLGGNCVVLAGVTIGKGSTVGAGSVVTKDVMPYTVVVGNPAQMIKEIEVGGSEGTDEGEDAARSRDVEVLAGEFTAKVSAEDD